MAEELQKQTRAMQQLVALSKKRTEMSAQRTYMNAERTLSVWLRTALAAMIFGIAIDRFGLMLDGPRPPAENLGWFPESSSAITGALLVFFSVLIAATAAFRFKKFAHQFKKEYSFPAYQNAKLPMAYALILVIFGLVLLLIMLGFI